MYEPNTFFKVTSFDERSIKTDAAKDAILIPKSVTFTRSITVKSVANKDKPIENPIITFLFTFIFFFGIGNIISKHPLFKIGVFFQKNVAYMMREFFTRVLTKIY